MRRIFMIALLLVGLLITQIGFLALKYEMFAIVGMGIGLWMTKDAILIIIKEWNE